MQDDMDEFVRVQGTQFVVGCRTWYASGWNQWEAMEAGAGALELFGASLPNKTTGPQVQERWGHASGDAVLPLQLPVWGLVGCRPW